MSQSDSLGNAISTKEDTACTWLATVRASGAQVTVDPFATGVRTRLVCPRSWQGSDCRTEAVGWVVLEVEVGVTELEDVCVLIWGATTANVWEIVPLNIFFLASSTYHRKKQALKIETLCSKSNACGCCTSSGDQLIPCFSRCVVNQTLICSSGCLEAAVSHESSAWVGYGNLLKEEMRVKLSSSEGLYLVVFKGTAILGTLSKKDISYYIFYISHVLKKAFSFSLLL